MKNMLCGGRNIDNLINTTLLNMKSRQVHMFCSWFSRFGMFCNVDRSKLVTESTHYEVS